LLCAEEVICKPNGNHISKPTNYVKYKDKEIQIYQYRKPANHETKTRKYQRKFSETTTKQIIKQNTMNLLIREENEDKRSFKNKSNFLCSEREKLIPEINLRSLSMMSL